MTEDKPLLFKAAWLVLAVAIPFVLLVAYAHGTSSWGIGWGPVIVSGLCGVTLFAVGPWSPTVRAVGSTVYAAAGLFIVPFMALLVECSTGNCL